MMHINTHQPDPNTMKRSLAHLPWLLVYLKLLVAVLLLVLAFSECSPLCIILLCLFALTGDVAGRMLANRLHLNRGELSQMISRVDTVFWFSCLFYLCINRHDFLKLHITALFALVSSELFIILFGLLMFRERLSFHTTLSRVWRLLLFWVFAQLISGRPVDTSFHIAFWCGLIAQLEILVMAFILKRNLTGVKHVVAALRHRKNLPAK